MSAVVEQVDPQSQTEQVLEAVPMRVSNRVNGADGFRAIACLLVMCHHAFQRLALPFIAPKFESALQYIFLRGEVGVSIFFVLSGCLLSMPFWSYRISGAPKPSIINYARNRITRIGPAFWFMMIISTFGGAWAFHTAVNWVHFWAGMTFTSEFYYKTLFPSDYNGVLWSIGNEVFCYVAMPILVFIIFKLTKSVKASGIALVAWIALLQWAQPFIIKHFMTGFAFKGWDYGLVGGAKIWMPYWNPVCFLSQFMIGSAAAFLIVLQRKNHFMKAMYWDVICIVAGLSAFALVLIRENPGNPDDWTHQPYVSPFYAILIAIALASAASGVWMYKVLDNRLFRYIAKISFGLYLWHLFIATIMQNTIAKDFYPGGVGDTFRWLDDVLLAYGVAFIIASLSYRYCEKPILDWNHRQIQKRSAGRSID
jgi:peptidoglycan/LPS O-acetylase OafA/YrhL